jgi:hypothetical protein
MIEELKVADYFQRVHGAVLEGIAFWSFPQDTYEFLPEFSEGKCLFPEVVELAFLDASPLYLSWMQTGHDHHLGVTTERFWGKFSLDRICMREVDLVPRLVGSHLTSMRAYTSPQVTEKRIVAIEHNFTCARGEVVDFWVATGTASNRRLLGDEVIASISKPPDMTELLSVIELGAD